MDQHRAASAYSHDDEYGISRGKYNDHHRRDYTGRSGGSRRGRSGSRSRSRSRSPAGVPVRYQGQDLDRRRNVGSRDRGYDEERRLKMERLRRENEEEERRQREATEESLAKQRAMEEDKTAVNQIKEFTEEELEGLSTEEQMKLMMGIGDFGSSKGKAVKDNQVGASRGAVSKSKARKYRQYMNRKGGFNRALDKMK